MTLDALLDRDNAPSLLDLIRPEARGAPESGIVEVANYGRGRQGLIPLWVGEGDLPTPGFIVDAAKASLDAGETFYTWQRGIPDLRETIARYMTGVYGPLFGKPYDPERFYVSIGGMHALQMALRMVAGAGDEVLVPSPAWPNFVGALGVSGATPVEVPMTLDPARAKGGWFLDIDRLADAVTPRTRVIVVNSPANPTGWTATRSELEAILALARRHGLWIVADEIYGRFVYEGDRAPSFHDIMDERDRILFVQTLSKNWAMTGWRVGWLECDPALGQTVENLMQYSASGVATFVQRAAAAAIAGGESFIALQKDKARQSRDILCPTLAATGRVRFAEPAGAFYLFFSVEGEPDTRRLALRLIDEANVGLAPGTAFGAGGESYMRLCFARNPADIAEAARRLALALGR
ncbi:pyridoxal phosphate-dependent aminotransferase [Alsobacter sp. SYSU M60028]|uniref:aspartate transaminase n=1 Tax=Alsobacter ponti TaxID=2962936 RepID=A0ABT1LH16_9HYPH|nr:pyridoxal phosphate-dependent aminotransferase [Alsobacter ponti]MCP8940010.1 pyridoxal phosphate-dependent aminotransferase [Alsobacter ponti]